ncbi:MAG: low-specificity L-threonine aldolase [Desulfobacterales bacterium]|nr:low-specificity L-threonine aldolase [Desulfobacterales bacterium]
MRIVDLRSDTVTRPTREMRKAMAEAEVGDDVFGEDPTVRKLEEAAADRLGKEAALFVTSGTMANLVSLMVHCGRGGEMILGDQAHIFYYEQGGSAAVGGIHPRTVPNRPDGTVDLDAVAAAVRADDVHFPRSRLLVLENTHNRCNGSPLDAGYMTEAGDLAHGLGLKLHVDGARIFNAAVALGTTPAELVAPADSASFCLSKGLSAPVGSMVCGSGAFVAEARRARKLLGGGMRQAGILAAAGLVALTRMVDRLEEDHQNAKRLAEGLAGIEGLAVSLERVRTNLVFIDTRETGMTAPELVDRLKALGTLCLASGPQQIRAVTHHPLSAADIDGALTAFREAVS